MCRFIMILCAGFVLVCLLSAWCDVDAFIAFFCGEYWVGCLMFFYQVSGHGLYLWLTDGVSFFVLFIFVSLLVGFCGG